jgi:hypothetical protein
VTRGFAERNAVCILQANAARRPFSRQAGAIRKLDLHQRAANVRTISEDTELEQIVEMMDVTRSKLMHAMVSMAPTAPAVPQSDAAIRDQLLAELKQLEWAPIAMTNVVVNNPGRQGGEGSPRLDRADLRRDRRAAGGEQHRAVEPARTARCRVPTQNSRCGTMLSPRIFDFHQSPSRPSGQSRRQAALSSAQR